MRRRARAEPSQGLPFAVTLVISDHGQRVILPPGPSVREFFSAAGGRAWVLDAEDSLAYCLMHDHVPRTSPLRGETAEDYALAWEEEFAIDEGCFWTFSPDGTATAHRGVPVDEIERTIRLARAHRSR
jgi:hypothetical protein